MRNSSQIWRDFELKLKYYDALLSCYEEANGNVEKFIILVNTLLETLCKDAQLDGQAYINSMIGAPYYDEFSIYKN